MIDDLGERLLFASFAKHQIKETESDHLDNRSVKNNQKENTMKKMALPLSRLSSDQKQDLMETVWKALAGDEKILESPAWHGSILQDRKRAYAMDKMTTADRGKAKKRMKKA